MRSASAHRKIVVALRAGRVSRSNKRDVPLMFDVARRTGRREFLFRVMNGAVMASQASLIGYRMAKRNGVRNVARRALLRKESVRCGQRAHAVRCAIFCQSGDNEPEERGRGKSNGEDKSPAAKRLRLLEVRQLDALRQFFCRSRTMWQIFAPNSLLIRTATP